MDSEKALCSLCGEPMPPGEQMFKFHGSSGPCPKPPLPKQFKPGEVVMIPAVIVKRSPHVEGYQAVMIIDDRSHDLDDEDDTDDVFINVAEAKIVKNS